MNAKPRTLNDREWFGLTGIKKFFTTTVSVQAVDEILNTQNIFVGDLVQYPKSVILIDGTANLIVETIVKPYEYEVNEPKTTIRLIPIPDALANSFEYKYKGENNE